MRTDGYEANSRFSQFCYCVGANLVLVGGGLRLGRDNVTLRAQHWFLRVL
jgi:hypothetical protein